MGSSSSKDAEVSFAQNQAAFLKKMCPNPKEAARVLKDIQSRGSLAAQDFLQSLDRNWQKEELHIALIGETGCGKSSYVNALLRATTWNATSSDGWALTGVLETTTNRTRYVHPENPQLVLWDLPGANGLNIPQQDYLKSTKIQVDAYNFFIILTKENFTEFDLWLATEIHKLGKRFIFVRTKVDLALQHMQYDDPTRWANASQEEMLDYVREAVQSAVKNAAAQWKANLNTKVFLINNKDPTQFEFAALQDEILERFPTEKRKALCMMLGPLSCKIVQAKVQTLQTYIWACAAVSAASAAVPLPGIGIVVDSSLIVGLFLHFQKHLGLDLQTAQRTAVAYGVPEKRLLKLVEKYMSARTVSEILMCVARIVPQALLAQGIEEAAKLLPLIAIAFTVPMSFVSTAVTAKYLLNDMAKTAEKMLAESLKSHHPGPFNIALIGEIKSGKSCFANAIRNLDRGNKDHAQIWARSDIRESTKTRTPYVHPEHKLMTFWDLPGMNGMNITKDNYFTSEDVQFAGYDFYIIFLTSRLTENVVRIAEELHKLGKEFVFVRTKVDEDVRNMRDERPELYIPESRMLRYLRDGLEPLLSQYKTKLYLVNNTDRSQFDFPALETDLLARFEEDQTPRTWQEAKNRW